MKRQLFIAMLAIGFAGLYSAPSLAQSSGLPCKGCTTVQQLQAAANAFARTTPYPADGTVLFIVSETANVSGYFKVASVMMCISSAGAHPCTSGGQIEKYTVAITLTDQEAQTIDVRMVAKAIGPISVAPSLGSSASSAFVPDVGTGIRQVIPIMVSMTGRYYVVIDGKTIYVVPGVTELVVKFPDGSKMRFRLSEDPRSTVAWEFLGATDANGNPINVNQSAPGSPPPNGPPPPMPPSPSVPNLCPVLISPTVCFEIPYSGDDCSSHIEAYFRPC